MALFEIRRRSHRPNYDGTTPAAADYLRGVAFMAGAGAAVALADGTKPLVGFITRQSLITGPTLADSIMPNRLELPFTSGEQASYEYAEEFEAEGVDYLSATNPILAGTPAGTPIAPLAGKWRIAQAGQIAEYALVAVLTPEVAGNVRIRAQRLPGAIKA